MRSKNFIEKRIEWSGILTELSIPVLAENCLQVNKYRRVFFFQFNSLFVTAVFESIPIF